MMANPNQPRPKEEHRILPWLDAPECSVLWWIHGCTETGGPHPKYAWACQLLREGIEATNSPFDNDVHRWARRAWAFLEGFRL